MLGIRTPSNPTACRWYSMAETKSMARSNTRITVLVHAALYPAVRFIRSSSLASASVRRFISARRAFPGRTAESQAIPETVQYEAAQVTGFGAKPHTVFPTEPGGDGGTATPTTR